MRALKGITLVAGLSALASCGAGGSGLSFSPLGSGPITDAELQTYFDDATALVNSMSTATVSLAVPSTATASYDGFAEIYATSSQSFLGRMTLNADFTNSTLSGSIGDFAQVSGSSTNLNIDKYASGTLPITNGTISGTSVAASLNGTLTTDDGAYGITSTMDGDFIDINGENHLVGFIDGQMTRPAASTIVVDGAYVAVQR